MRRLAILLLFASAISAHAASYETRTPRHAVAVEIVPGSGDNVVFGVIVTDLPGGQVLASPRLSGKIGTPAETQVDIGEQHLEIRVSLVGTNLTCGLDITKGDVIIEAIHSVWSIQPTRDPRTLPEGVLRVGGDVKAPVVLQHVAPSYPEAARKARISGIVILEAIIDHTGALKNLIVLKPLPFGLDQAALDAVKQWTFAPGTQNGKPVDVIFNVTLNFKLDTPKPPEAH